MAFDCNKKWRKEWLPNYRNDFLKFHSNARAPVEEKEEVVLFGREFYFWSSLLSDGEWLFDMCRKKFMELSSIITVTPDRIGNGKELHQLASQFRADISAFLNYVDHYFEACSENLMKSQLLAGELQFLEANLNNFRNLFSHYYMFHCNKQLLPLYLAAHSGLPNAEYFLLHCHLDVRRFFVKIKANSEKIKTKINFSRPNGKISRNYFNDSDESVVSLMMSEMMLLALMNCQNAERDDINKLIFPCRCIEEFWHGLLSAHREVFWKCFNDILDTMMEHKIPSKNEKLKNIFILIYRQAKYLTEFSFNVFVNVVESADRDRSDNGKPHWMKNERFVHALVKNFLDCHPSEGSLRRLMTLVLSVIDWWENREELLMFLWEFFHERFNCMFLLHGQASNPRMVERMTPREMLEEARNRFDPEKTADETEDSLSLFMRIIGHHLLQCRSLTKARARMFGRIYIKFQTSRKFLVLSELGIYRMTSLFLTMAFALDIEKQAERYYDVLKLAPTKQLIPCKRRIVCKSIAAFVTLLDEHGFDVQDFAGLLLREVEYAISTRDDDDVPTLIECLKSFLEKRNNKISVFIGPWIDVYLNTFGDAVVDSIVQTFRPLILDIKKGVEGWSEEDVDGIKKKIYAHFLPLAETHRFASTAEFAAGLVSVLMRDPGNSQRLFTLFRLWINCKEDVVFYKFLGTLFEDEDVSLLAKFFCGYGIFFVKRFIKAYFVSDGIVEPDLFVKVVKFVPEVALHCSSHDDDDEWFNKGDDDILESFICLFGRISNEMSTDRKQLSKLFSSFFDLDEWLSVALKNLDDETLAKNLFRYTSLMTRECCYLMYDRYDDRCLLSKIMKRLVLPWEAYNNKGRTSEAVNRALRHYLHNYIDGICKIASGEDIYLKGIVRDLIRCYFPRSTNSAVGDAKSHPLHKSLSNLNNLEYLMDIIKNLYLNPKSYSRAADTEDCLIFLSHVQRDDVGDKTFDLCIGNVLDLLLESKLGSRGESLSARYVSLNVNRSTACRRSMVRCLRSLLEHRGKYDPIVLFKVLNKFARICPRELSAVKPDLDRLIQDLEQDAGSESSLRELERELRTVLEESAANVGASD